MTSLHRPVPAQGQNLERTMYTWLFDVEDEEDADEDKDEEAAVDVAIVIIAAT